MNDNLIRVGIDVGSTTVKIAALDAKNNLIYQKYMRHNSDLYTSVKQILSDAYLNLGDISISVACTGSGGLGVSQKLEIKFNQEVIAATKTIRTFNPETDVAIELGGEDAKITYFSGTVEQRMNGTCAGGTGAFIDQMATLMGTDAKGLDILAAKHEIIYPIAARCGVFAKSDVQPLLNEGASRQDIAASIFQAVVNQTIGGLACGRPIRGKVAYLGGPLSFMPELRRLFSKTLKLTPEQIIEPENAKLYVAIGCAMLADDKKIKMSELLKKWEISNNTDNDFSLQSLNPLFKDENEYKEFKKRHNKATIKRKPLSDYSGKCYLGIDAGSTTTKLVLIGENNELLADYYKQNKGNPLEVMVSFLKDLYSKIPTNAAIVHSAVTGYGEALIQSAFGVDIGEVETVAHFVAASHFDPKVEFLLDIGGQDMKCITIKDGIINQVILNEACSSGCGSFIESLSASIGLDVSEFANEAIFAENPMDLGTRCTVFMNSRIKQVQKEGAKIGDISAGLSYSVIKNALYKVIKLRNPDDLGGHIIVQGGTFLNDAILRALEIITDRQVVRPQIAGLMGAFGAALIAKEKYDKPISSTLCNKESLDNFSVNKTNMRCNKCENSCLLTLNKFNNGQRHLSGNKCEKGAGHINANTKNLPNLYDRKNKLIFDMPTIRLQDIKRGSVGIPRGLNMFENYPFWHTFFTSLGFEVILSGTSNKSLYEKGLESIPSESECYPAKLMHGHIMDLIEKNCDFIFYPCIPYEFEETNGVDNHYNCPIVVSYAENIKNNVEPIREGDVKFLRPFVTLHNPKVLKKQLTEVFKPMGIKRSEINNAVTAAFAKLAFIRKEIRNMGEKALEGVKNGDYPGIVLAGRPYHVDHEIHHGIPATINQLGFAVFTEDSICHLAKDYKKLRILDQWVYHSRLYAAANVVGITDNLELVQLNSFGCGLDAITTDQVEEILRAYKKTYTVIKIDEVSNLGAAKIRLRSLKAAIENRMQAIKKTNENDIPSKYKSYEPALFEENMKESYTVIAPQMSPIHFALLEHAFRVDGLKLEILPKVSRNAKELGLKYVNNDACYPAIIVIGQLMEAIESGRYNTDKLAVMISQTGGSCRASNYLALLRKALDDKGLSHIPAISFSTGLEKHPGFKISMRMLISLIMSLIYGDLFNRVTLRCRPYEKVDGSVHRLHKKWEKIAIENLYNQKISVFRRNIKQIVMEFDQIELAGNRKPRVGIVGEILVKYHPGGNNELVGLLESLDAEAVVPDLYDFILYTFYAKLYISKRLKPSYIGVIINNILIEILEVFRRPAKSALAKSSRFDHLSTIRQIAKRAKPFLSLGNLSGEGWFLTGEMASLIEEGVENIVCTQPFGCLPNHIVGKGTVRALRDKYPTSNIVPIDYDPGDTNVNQVNRIKLMLSIAKENEIFKKLNISNIT